MKNKTTIAFTLVLLYAVALLKPAFPLVDYFIRLNDYKKRCINQSRPEMHCNGQCILMKKIVALETNNPADKAPAPVKIDLQDYPIGLLSASFVPVTACGTTITWKHHHMVTARSEFTCDIFHPPAFPAIA